MLVGGHEHLGERESMDELETLLLPVTRGALAESWNREALYVPGDPEKFSALFDRDSWNWTLERTDGVSVHTDDGKDRLARREQIERAVELGLTVCADVSKEPRLARFLAGLKRCLQAVGDPLAACYVSDAGHGLPLHWDAYHVFVLQIEGSKEWRFSRHPAVASPLASHYATSEEPYPLPHDPPTDLEAVVLTAGDLLYLPPGAWHEAKAIERSTAISLSPERKSIAGLMLDLVEERLKDSPAWRAHAPMTVAAETPPGRVRETFEERLGELAQLIRSLDASDFLEHWQRLAAIPGDEDPDAEAQD